MNVKSIHGGPVGLPEPNDTCIAELRDLVEKAEAGEIVGVAVVVLDRKSMGFWRIAGKVGGYSMLGALEVLRADLLRLVERRDA